LTHHNAGKDDGPWTYKDIFFNSYASGFLEMGNHGGAHADRNAVSYRNQFGARCLKDHVVSNPRVLSDAHSAQAMEQHAKPRPRSGPGNVLQYTVLQTTNYPLFFQSHAYISSGPYFGMQRKSRPAGDWPISGE
jgi:hypothetical protein